MTQLLSPDEAAAASLERDTMLEALGRRALELAVLYGRPLVPVSGDAVRAIIRMLALDPDARNIFDGVVEASRADFLVDPPSKFCVECGSEIAKPVLGLAREERCYGCV